MARESVATKDILRLMTCDALELAEGAQVELLENAGNNRASDVALVSIAKSLAVIAILASEAIYGCASLSTYDVGR